jgi:hypothetical protein
LVEIILLPLGSKNPSITEGRSRLLIGS